MTWKTYDTDYEVSDTGSIRRLSPGKNTTTGRLLRNYSVGNAGYQYVKIKGRGHLVARLVACLYIGDPPTPTAVICYRDGDPRNVTASNLFWAVRRTVFKELSPVNYKEVN